MPDRRGPLVTRDDLGRALNGDIKVVRAFEKLFANIVADGIYADDEAAAAAGVTIGQPYRKTGGSLAYRVI